MLSQAAEHIPTIVGAALLATSGVAVYSTYKLLTIDRDRRAKENVYETAKLVNEYLVFHYGAPREVLRYDYGPTDGLDFARRVADECLEVYRCKVNKVFIILFKNVFNYYKYKCFNSKHKNTIIGPTK